jgi:tetrahydromethanopterin S-methyltransferase subunit A
MGVDDFIAAVRAELSEGVAMPKCRKCGCMKEVLEQLASTLPADTADEHQLRDEVEQWLKRMEPVQYACLGCEHCYPAIALDFAGRAFPGLESQGVACEFDVRSGWPPVAGEYVASCSGGGCPVAVSTLASTGLVTELAAAHLPELCIVGKTETENIGIDKIIKNTVTNPTIRTLILAGEDPKGHQPGRTLLALIENGVDETMRVIGSPGKRPVLRNVSRSEVEAFRTQVRVVDMIGTTDASAVARKVKEVGAVPETRVTPWRHGASRSSPLRCRSASKLESLRGSRWTGRDISSSSRNKRSRQSSSSTTHTKTAYCTPSKARRPGACIRRSSRTAG